MYEELIDLASEGQNQGWWNDFKDLGDEGLPEHIGRCIAPEQGATRLHGYEVLRIRWSCA